MQKPFTHLGLFEGIGGFSLAARWMGWKTVAWCEWNPFGQKVLRHHFPEAIGHGDITKTDFTPYANTINILTGGFPCQPFSVAGEQLGSEDERYLFPEMFRAIREIKPRWIVAENVYGITTDKFGNVFEEIYSSLAAEGYEVQTYIIPASAVGAPHERYRTWFVAHSGSLRLQSQEQNAELGRQRSSERSGTEDQWESFNLSASDITRKDDGLPEGLDTSAISFNQWREGSVMAYGNAIVPQVAYQIFKAIEQYEKSI